MTQQGQSVDIEEWVRLQQQPERVASRLGELDATWRDQARRHGVVTGDARVALESCARAVRKLRRQVLEGSL